MEQFKHKFIEEAYDLIEELEKASLELSADPSNTSYIEVIFRVMHSLKGSSAMFGFDKIDAFTHHLESAYDQVRKGQRKADDKLMEITFKSIDHIKALLQEDDKISDETLQNHTLLLKAITSLRQVESASAYKEPSDGLESTPGRDLNEATYYIRFLPKTDIFKNGTNPLLIINELVSLGESKVFPLTMDIPEFTKIDVLSCYTSWVVLLATDSSEDNIREVFMFVDLDCELVIKKLSSQNLIRNSEFIKKVEEAQRISGTPGLNDLEKLVADMNGPTNDKKPADSGIMAPDTKNHGLTSIRVSSEKLDELINLVSELVTTQAGLSLLAEKINSKELLVIAEDVEKLSRRLRDSTFGVRLIPIDNMITRFQRLVRELSHTLKKEVVFTTEGTDIELDKTMIEGLIDPIMHILRNCLDHGIECPEERIKLGKQPRGNISFKAFHSGSNVFIQVTDNGAGMDVQKIRQHAIRKGLIQSNSVLSDKEILDMIFLPGFTTKEKLTNISGRGVGMDVVKRNIADLRGEVSIETKVNTGTTITIKLPLTLSIIDGLLVKIDEAYYIIPLASVNKCFEFRHETLLNAVNNMIYVNDGHIPFIYLRKEFGITTKNPEIEQVIVIEYGDARIGITVDKVIGEYQAVLKSIGSIYKKQDIVSGATILGDGTVALVMDPNKIISHFNYHSIAS